MATSWRKKVLDRNQRSLLEGKCSMCQEAPAVEAHHVYPKKDYPELRTEVRNGVGLCKSCHEGIHATRTEYKVADQLTLVQDSVAPGITVAQFLHTLVGRIHQNRALIEEIKRNNYARR
jgi:hypothetical protein